MIPTWHTEIIVCIVNKGFVGHRTYAAFTRTCITHLIRIMYIFFIVKQGSFFFIDFYVIKFIAKFEDTKSHSSRTENSMTKQKDKNTDNVQYHCQSFYT
jgi:hypothetical protein